MAIIINAIELTSIYIIKKMTEYVGLVMYQQNSQLNKKPGAQIHSHTTYFDEFALFFCRSFVIVLHSNRSAFKCDVNF